MQRKCKYKGHLQFYKMADIMLLLKNEDLPYWVGEEKTWLEKKKNGEKSCWPGLRQIDSSIDFPFSSDCPSLTAVITLTYFRKNKTKKNPKKTTTVYYGLNQNVQKENTAFVEKTSGVRWNITYSLEKENRFSQFKHSVFLWEKKK